MKNLFQYLFGHKNEEQKSIDNAIDYDKIDNHQVDIYPKIKTFLKKEDVPEFARIYSGIICGNIEIIITMETRDYGLSWNDPNKRNICGLLKQPNKSSVSFDVDNIADKIILPNIVEEAENFVQHVKKMDDEFCSNERNSFIDKRGTKWIRENSI